MIVYGVSITGPENDLAKARGVLRAKEMNVHKLDLNKTTPLGQYTKDKVRPDKVRLICYGRA